MIYLILSILSASLLILIFKGFSTYKVDALQAIVVNYFVCLIFGLSFTSIDQLKMLPKWDGLPLSLLLGGSFVFIFFTVAKTTQILGVAVASVAQKLSFIIPVMAGILFFNEASTFSKYLGLLMAILSVILISSNAANRPKEDKTATPSKFTSKKAQLLLPFIVFIGSGCCDLVVNIIEHNFIGEVETPAFTVVLFLMASVMGSVIFLIQMIQGKTKPAFRNLVGGIILGIPNYASLYFLVLSLNQSGLDSSQVFPINNVGIILTSVVAAGVFFNERLNFKQAIGLVCAIATILILI
jgi:drug/metabolite transporter (DMT)-like permease